METYIAKTERGALERAFFEVLRDFPFIHPNIINKNDVLIRYASINCACGETGALHVTYFDSANSQHYALVGICESCGTDDYDGEQLPDWSQSIPINSLPR